MAEAIFYAVILIGMAIVALIIDVKEERTRKKRMEKELHRLEELTRYHHAHKAALQEDKGWN